MKTKRIISLILSSIMLLAFAAAGVSCDSENTPDGGDKMLVIVEVYYTDNEGTESIFLKDVELEVNIGASANDALIALIDKRGGTYKAIGDGTIDSITFDGTTIAQKNKSVSSDANMTVNKYTHFICTVNGAEFDESPTAHIVKDGDKIVYKLVTEDITVTVGK